MKCHPKLGIQFEQKILLSSETVQIQWVHLFWHLVQIKMTPFKYIPCLSSLWFTLQGGLRDTQTGSLWEAAVGEDVLQDHIPCIPRVTGHWCSGPGHTLKCVCFEYECQAPAPAGLLRKAPSFGPNLADIEGTFCTQNLIFSQRWGVSAEASGRRSLPA